ncbi:transposable element Tcb2 transposase [Trichonephila clavipes]|nr:transposable element Tcb2 transposase [Trichonephila clavipes]
MDSTTRCSPPGRKKRASDALNIPMGPVLGGSGKSGKLNTEIGDESKFNIFGSDGHSTVWRKPRTNTALDPKSLHLTVKHGGGSVMVWGCMASNGVGNLVFIDDIMDHKLYIDILNNNLKESAKKLGLDGNFIFQEDNDPKHTARNVKMWCLFHCKQQLHTPPQSPDINIIENLWPTLETAVQKHQIRNKVHLKQVLQEEWDKISPDTTKNWSNRYQDVWRTL